jgi:hypothetical protein
MSRFFGFRTLLASEEGDRFAFLGSGDAPGRLGRPTTRGA